MGGVPEKAKYDFLEEDMEGNEKVLTNRSNYNLVYNDLDENWYYHSISEENIIDIDNLKIKR
ncbi:MAG: hypothetical protein ACOCRV_01050 [bacterium]